MTTGERIREKLKIQSAAEPNSFHVTISKVLAEQAATELDELYELRRKHELAQSVLRKAFNGTRHDPGCHEDDTCDCPIIKRLINALKSPAESYLDMLLDRARLDYLERVHFIRVMATMSQPAIVCTTMAIVLEGESLRDAIDKELAK